MGYVVDDLAARARYLPDLETDLKTLRGELTRVITELRLSIFDLRSEVQTDHRARHRAVRLRASGRRELEPHRAPRPRRVADAAADRRRDRAAADRPGGGHQRPQARQRGRTCGSPAGSTRRRPTWHRGRRRRPRPAATDSFGLEVMRERADADRRPAGRRQPGRGRHSGRGDARCPSGSPTRVVIVSTTVVLVDDHELIRQGLRRAFERTGDFTVRRRGGHGRRGARADHQPTPPDVVIFDVRLPDGSGLDAARRCARRTPRWASSCSRCTPATTSCSARSRPAPRPSCPRTRRPTTSSRPRGTPRCRRARSPPTTWPAPCSAGCPRPGPS